MSERAEIYRDPHRDSALFDLSPYIRLSIPMHLIAKYGSLHVDRDKLEKKIKEVYSLLSLGSAENETLLSEALEQSGNS